ncbi:hypothetical protein [Natrinema sp. CGMCC1.2065]|uniref:hypothetical protein n=1 Tax=Natrinema sp. CGMCC1.2065 TaxID=3445767 RepID=UPI003F4A243D
MEPKDPDAPIDPYSEYDLYDVINGDLPMGETTEYEGLHLTAGGNEVMVIPDGHAGTVDEIDPADYDDVLELVADLNKHVRLWNELEEDELLEWAGPLVTTDESKQDDDRFVVVPDEPASS